MSFYSKKCFSAIVFILSIHFFPAHMNAQKMAAKEKLKTASLGGAFEYGRDIEKGAIGLISVYPETDSTILFFIDVNRGAPSYNMGNLYGRLKVKSGIGVFNKNIGATEKTCKLEFKFENNILRVLTIEDNDNCGFGYGVMADGTYKRKSKKIPVHFIDATGEKYYFNETNPDKWERN